MGRRGKSLISVAIVFAAAGAWAVPAEDPVMRRERVRMSPVYREYVERHRETLNRYPFPPNVTKPSQLGYDQIPTGVPKIAVAFWLWEQGGYTGPVFGLNRETVERLLLNEPTKISYDTFKKEWAGTDVTHGKEVYVDLMTAWKQGKFTAAQQATNRQDTPPGSGSEPGSQTTPAGRPEGDAGGETTPPPTPPPAAEAPPAPEPPPAAAPPTADASPPSGQGPTPPSGTGGEPVGTGGGDPVGTGGGARTGNGGAGGPDIYLFNGRPNQSMGGLFGTEKRHGGGGGGIRSLAQPGTSPDTKAVSALLDGKAPPESGEGDFSISGASAGTGLSSARLSPADVSAGLQLLTPLLTRIQNGEDPSILRPQLNLLRSLAATPELSQGLRDAVQGVIRQVEMGFPSATTESDKSAGPGTVVLVRGGGEARETALSLSAEERRAAEQKLALIESNLFGKSSEESLLAKAVGGDGMAPARDVVAAGSGGILDSITSVLGALVDLVRGRSADRVHRAVAGTGPGAEAPGTMARLASRFQLPKFVAGFFSDEELPARDSLGPMDGGEMLVVMGATLVPSLFGWALTAFVRGRGRRRELEALARMMRESSGGSGGVG